MESASKFDVNTVGSDLRLTGLIAAHWIDPTELATRYYDYQTKMYPPSSQVWPYAMKTEQWVVREILVLLSGCTSELFSIDNSNASDVKIDMKMQVQISSLTPQTLEQALQYWVQGAVIVQQIQTVIDRLNSSTDLGLCYRAFGRSLWTIMHPFKRHIAELEANRPDLTLASLQVTLRWHIEQIKFIHSVVQRAILTDSFLPLSQRKHSTAERSSYLLTALYSVLDEVSRGDEEPFKVTLKLFLDSLTPLLNMAHHWMHEGSLRFQYLKDEFFVIEDEALDYQAPAVCWKNKFELRTKERTGTTPQTPEKQQRKILVVPSFMKEIAQLVLHTGKAIHLIQSMGKNEQWTTQTTHKQPSRASLMTRLTALDQLSKHTCTEVLQQIEEQLTRHKREEFQPFDYNPHDLTDANATDLMTSEDEVMAVMNKLKALIGTREDSSQLSKDLFKLASGPQQPPPVHIKKPQQAVDSQQFDYKSVTLPIMPISFLVAETLHDAIERRYNTVNQYLLNVLIADCRLLDHLRTLRQFFFLENGFVWHLFIKNVFDFLQQDGTKYLNVVELNHMLQESIHEDKSVPFSDLILIQLVNPTMSQSSMNKTRVNQTQLSGNATIDINVNQTFMSSQSVVAPSHVPVDVPATPGNRVDHEGIESEEVFIKNLNDTDKIRLSYRVSFPLDILLSPDVLAEYNNIMSFIFRIKRSKFVLDQLLFIHKETTGLTDLKIKSASVNVAKGKNEMTPALRDMKAFYHKLNLFRGTLIHFVNNLQHYVGTRVVEMAWNELADEIKSAKDFDYLIDFHQRYLSSIRDKCLLNKNVSRLRLLITRILDMSMVLKSLYDIMPSYVSLSVATKEKLNANYERIVDDFNQSHKLLTTVLHQIVQQKRLPHLEDLLVKLNYNNYYNYNTNASSVVLAKK